jgi:hypothetical protein
MGDVRARRTERLFRIALLVKGVDGAAELVAAAALLPRTPRCPPRGGG